MKNYFKRFSIMFVMLLAVSGFGIIQNGTVANAVVGQQLKESENGWQRIDDREPKIKYEGNWSANNGFTSSEYLNCNTHAIASPSTNSKILFYFYGTKIRLLSDISPGRTGKFDVYIDNQFIGRYDQYNTTSKYFSIYFEKLDLNKAVHKIEIKNIEYNTTYNDSGYLFVFDAIDIDDTGFLVDTNESITLNKSTIDLKEGDSEQLTATTTPAGVGVTWKSSDENIAKYDSTTGKVIAGSVAGTCTITATINDGSGLSATCEVTVTEGTIDPPPVEPTEPTGDGKLFIELVDGNIKSYDVSSDKISNFIDWYNDRDNDDSKSPYFKFTSKDGYKDYVVHDKIDWFEVR